MSDRQSTARRPRFSRTALVGAITALLIVLAPTAAHATNGGDPAAGCDSQGVTPHYDTALYDGSTYMGHVYLNYSSGCKTEWTIVKTVAGYKGDPSIWLQSGGGNLTVAASSGLRTRWSYQLANMQYTVGCGGVQMYRDNGSWVNWYPVSHCY